MKQVLWDQHWRVSVGPYGHPLVRDPRIPEGNIAMMFSK